MSDRRIDPVSESSQVGNGDTSVARHALEVWGEVFDQIWKPTPTQEWLLGLTETLRRFNEKP